MINRKSILGFNAVAALVMIVALTTTTTGTTILDAQAQNVDTSEQIRKYLIQAVRALDSGDNTEAIRQLQLATDQMGSFTAISEQSFDGQVNSDGQGISDGQGNSDGENDNGEESEEGSGEDADEPGDTDENDEED